MPEDQPRPGTIVLTRTWSRMVPPPSMSSRRRKKIAKRTSSSATTQIPKTSRIRIAASVRFGGGRGGALGQDRYAVGVDGEEAAGHVVRQLLAAADFDADLRWLLEQSEQWRMAGQHTDLTLGGAGHEHFGLAGPDLLLD